MPVSWISTQSATLCIKSHKIDFWTSNITTIAHHCEHHLQHCNTSSCCSFYLTSFKAPIIPHLYLPFTMPNFPSASYLDNPKYLEKTEQLQVHFCDEEIVPDLRYFEAFYNLTAPAMNLQHRKPHCVKGTSAIKIYRKLWYRVLKRNITTEVALNMYCKSINLDPSCWKQFPRFVSGSGFTGPHTYERLMNDIKAINDQLPSGEKVPTRFSARLRKFDPLAKITPASYGASK